ncbi:MAG: zinc-dependent alcohol dehydrogenase family protein [Chlamydiota bacterium]|nr:zinc-dependent alcohol dehydrogenase family protein [Chlamydiota bacterium]
MRAMVMEKMGEPLLLKEVPKPEPDKNQVRIRVHACGVCRTDLHIFDGDLTKPKLPLIPGHQIIGTIDLIGVNVKSLSVGQKVGIPWLGATCQHCSYCSKSKENLCDDPTFTGYTIDGGYAEYCVANEKYCFPIPENYSDIHATPLLCAGMIGYRSYRMTENATKIGFYGFGAAAHILIQLACYEGKEIYVFTRDGDTSGQELARKMGAVWAGSSKEPAPIGLDAAIIFAPAGPLIPQALRSLSKGGVVVCAGIHMSEIPAFPYSILWGERVVRSVANLTRKDGEEFLALAPKVPIKTEVATYDLSKANEALNDLRKGRISGSAVLTMDGRINL